MYAKKIKQHLPIRPTCNILRPHNPKTMHPTAIHPAHMCNILVFGAEKLQQFRWCIYLENSSQLRTQNRLVAVFVNVLFACLHSEKTGCKKKYYTRIYTIAPKTFSISEIRCVWRCTSTIIRECACLHVAFFLFLVGCEIFNHFVECGAVAAIWLRALVDFFFVRRRK